MTLTPWEERDIRALGDMLVKTLKALQRIHELVCEPSDAALETVRAVALTTILEVEARMEEIDR